VLHDGLAVEVADPVVDRVLDDGAAADALVDDARRHLALAEARHLHLLGDVLVGVLEARPQVLVRHLDGELDLGGFQRLDGALHDDVLLVFRWVPGTGSSLGWRDLRPLAQPVNPTARLRSGAPRGAGGADGTLEAPLAAQRARATLTIVLAVQPFALVAMSTYRVPVRALLARTLSVADLAPSTAVQARAPGALAYHWSRARGLAATCAVNVAALPTLALACLGCLTNTGRPSRTVTFAALDRTVPALFENTARYRTPSVLWLATTVK